MKRLFPLFLKLDGRKCLIVGAGKIAESKIVSLLATGAHLHVVAPQATQRIKAWALERRVCWSKRGFRESDLLGCFLVVAATSSTELHKRIFRSARRRRVICNIVDVPALCDFYYPAVVERGPLQIAVSTGGRSPALAQRLREELEVQFGPEYGKWVRHLGRERLRVRTKGTDAEKLRAELRQLATDASFRRFLRSQKAKIRVHK
jgi:precorrin-2 dehydrogenase / sirohydrochlorin ferrochelatase